MSSSVLDPCLFFKNTEHENDVHEKKGLSPLKALVGTQVDDTLCAGDVEFTVLEEQESKIFNSKPKLCSLPFKFNGSWIDKSRNGSACVMNQDEYCY